MSSRSVPADSDWIKKNLLREPRENQPVTCSEHDVTDLGCSLCRAACLNADPPPLSEVARRLKERMRPAADAELARSLAAQFGQSFFRTPPMTFDTTPPPPGGSYSNLLPKEPMPKERRSVLRHELLVQRVFPGKPVEAPAPRKTSADQFAKWNYVGMQWNGESVAILWETRFYETVEE